jgi:predicted transcriptional regulator
MKIEHHNLYKEDEIQISKSKLEEIYHSMSNEEAAKILGVTQATLIRYIKECNISLKGSGHKRKLKITD